MFLALTLLLIGLIVYGAVRSGIDTFIVLLSIPFALVGTVWLLYLLDYRLSTAVWVGVIALTGLAAQTGIVMIVYIDQAFFRRLRAGKVRDLNDIIWAHMEGTVLRVRPKAMTVAVILAGLVPIVWGSGTGSEVMSRIAAPMLGGMVTAPLLSLFVVPAVFALLRSRLQGSAPA